MFQKDLLKGKTAVITGGGRGIGKAIALGFAQAGATVSICSRSQDELDAVVEVIKSTGKEAYAKTCDVSNQDDVKSFMDYSVQNLGVIDILVVNAGINPEKALVVESSPEKWKQTIEVNLVGAYYTVYSAIPHMIERKQGKIIFIGSGKGHRGSPRGSAYACSKSGIWMLTRVLGEELEDYHIDVNELTPGPTITDMNTVFGKDIDSIFTSGKEWVKQPEDVVPLALFLASLPFRGPTQQSYSLMRRQVF